jgi:tRNA nucleotidyltransferase (CCA-adding enzyme)
VAPRRERAPRGAEQEAPAPGDVAGQAGAVPGPLAAEAIVRAAVPAAVVAVIDQLHRGGHAAFVVGGSVRDPLLGRPATSAWDLATSALPDEVVELFHGAVYENRFGMVALRRDGEELEITTFRTDHEYADFRRPHRVEFGADLEADLARRDFTVNAIAWGRPAPHGEPGPGAPAVLDPFGGLGDLADRRLRAVGDPDARFREDALRMVRAVRLAATLDMTVEPATLVAISANSPLAAHLSGERVLGELMKLLAAPRPSVGLRIASETGLLAILVPELAAQRGVPQNKVPGEDLWDHTLRTVDAAPASRPVVRLAALLHDLGKPATRADGRFHHHDLVGAEMAAGLLRRLHAPRAGIDEVTHLVRLHMFSVDPEASGTAVRRFIRRAGREHLDALFALRRADDIGSGLADDDPRLVAFRARVDAELEAEVALDRNALAVDGDDLIRELGLEPGPRLGRLLDALVEAVITDPALNERATLLLLVEAMLADADRDAADRGSGPDGGAGPVAAPAGDDRP